MQKKLVYSFMACNQILDKIEILLLFNNHNYNWPIKNLHFLFQKVLALQYVPQHLTKALIIYSDTGVLSVSFQNVCLFQ